MSKYMFRTHLSQIAKTNIDVLVIGGGINGASVARELAMRGVSVLLCEKDDFSSGTSSASSKLVHGGIRYLKNFQFGLVREASRERALLLKHASHLVKPLSFMIPVYNDSPMPPWMIKLGTKLYQWLSYPWSIGESEWIDADEALEREPWIRKEGLLGATVYPDAQMDDMRVCLETILHAQSLGASVMNYAPVTDLEFLGRDQGYRVSVSDRIRGEAQELYVSMVVNATGPWADHFLKKQLKSTDTYLRPSKGIHLLTKRVCKSNAIVVMSESDSRVFFVIPWGPYSMIGTTDTAYRGVPDNVRVTKRDIQYLLKECRKQFPDISLSKDDVIMSFSGIRPLVKAKGRVGKISRHHRLIWHTRCMVSVLGGKYTTFRKIGEDVAKAVCSRLKVRDGVRSMSKDRALFGGGIQNLTHFIDHNFVRDTDEIPVSKEIYSYAVHRYGTAYKDFLLILMEDASYFNRLSGANILKADVIYSIRSELALTISDFMFRRAGFKYEDGHGESCVSEVAQLFQKELQLSDDDIKKQIENYKVSVNEYKNV